ncbi:MAG TPA: MmgE/PrpD family protein [Limnochordales bacterium]
MQAGEGYTERLLDYCFSLDYSRLPEAVLDHLKKLVLDYLGVALGGSVFADSTPVITAGLRSLVQGMPAGATAIGQPDPYPAQYAALLNATLAHSMDFDDTHRDAVIHIGAPVLSVAMAVAEQQGASGAAFLSAAAKGYQVTGRIGRAFGDRINARGFHPTATTGIFGATLAGADLLGLDRDAVHRAWGLNLSQASGSQQFLQDGSWNKRLHPGMAAHNAMLALAMARAGFRGAREVFEGRYGYAVLYGGGQWNPERTFAADNPEYEVLATGVKPYPNCRYVHALIDGVVDLANRHDLRPETVARIHVHLDRVGTQLVAQPPEVKRRPVTIVDGQFSGYFAAAVALAERSFTWKHYELMPSEKMRELMDRVEIEADPELPSMAARIAITTTDGRELSATVLKPAGEPETFPTWEELDKKFMSLAVPALGERQAAAVAATVRRLEELPRISELTALLRPAR